jgi:peptide/nickel transport system substrate-binding protein
VVEAVEEPGRYGGDWRQVHLGAPDRMQNVYLMQEHLGRWDRTHSRVIPSVAKGWEWSPDGRTITFHLRPGMKWSDGDDFDADDFVFWYEDMIKFPLLADRIDDQELQVGGSLAQLAKVDRYTFTITFAAPNYIFEEMLPSYEFEPIVPSHYLKRFHPRYAGQARIDSAMAVDGASVWKDWFYLKYYPMSPQSVGTPTLWAWTQTNALDQPVQVLARNPYYWKVDTEGRQLPYVDRVVRTLMPNSEAMLLKAVAGEADYQSRRITGVKNRTVLVENQERGQYRVVNAGNPGFNEGVIFFNFWQDRDPLRRRLYNDLAFRVALSVAIDRREINEIVYKGLANPGNALTGRDSPLYDQANADRHAEYDPDQANRLLDSLGLARRDGQGFRLRPDNGERFSMVVNLYAEGAVGPSELMELVKKHWAAVGLELGIRPMERTLWHAARQAYDFDLSSYTMGVDSPGRPAYAFAQQFYFAHNQYVYWGQKWADWLMTGGQKGVAAPPGARRLYEILRQLPSVPTPEGRRELQREAHRIYAENLWMIGTVNGPPQGNFFVARNDFRNIPTQDAFFDPEANETSHWFFKR